jgi:malonyl-CoA O-methyltransferase
MLQTVNNKIQQRFSESAKSYDLFTGLHRAIADRLFDLAVNESRPSAILDVGCGTGYLTVKLKEHFPQINMIGLDLSPGMLEVACRKHDGISWVLADGNKLPFSDGSFDVLISNLAYQWAGDLSGAFHEARRVLVPNGVLACTLFGYNTCHELFQSLQDAGAKTLQFTRLPDISRVRQALAAGGFKNPKIGSERIKVEFNGMHGLIDWLRSIGADNLSRTGYLGPQAIARAASIYRKEYPYLQGVGATFEVI